MSRASALLARYLVDVYFYVLPAAVDVVRGSADSRGWIGAFKGLPPPQRPRRALQILSGSAVATCLPALALLVPSLVLLLLQRKVFRIFRLTSEVQVLE